MIYFDKKTLSVLRFIKSSGDKGVTWGKLRKKFGDDACVQLLINFTNEEYVVTKDSCGNWIYKNEFPIMLDSDFRSFSTPKANELIETRVFNFWKWIIPTFISLVALVMSIVTFIVQLQ